MKVKYFLLWLTGRTEILIQPNVSVFSYVDFWFSRVRTERDGTSAETRFGFPAKRTSPFISAGVSVQSSTGFLGVRVGRERL